MPKQYIAENARRLRLSQGLTQQELADLAHLSRPAYRNIEMGRSIPRVSTLQNIAKALNVKLQDLVRPVPQLRGVRFRAHKRMIRRENVLADVAQRLEDINILEQLLGETSPYVFEELAESLNEVESGRNRALLAAEKARQLLELPLTECIRDMCGLVESSGIKLLLIKLASPDFFGLSVAGDSEGPAIAVNVWENISVERWIFTTAHELGHLLLHLNSYDVSEIEEDHEEEKEASIFASHFLMPNEVFMKEWDESRGLPFIDRVFKLKRMFRVSYKTVLYRLVENDMGDSRIWVRFQHAYQQRTGKYLKKADEPESLPHDSFLFSEGEASEEPDRLSETDFIPDRAYALVRSAVEKGLITLGRAAEILRISLGEMRQVAAAWEQL